VTRCDNATIYIYIYIYIGLLLPVKITYLSPEASLSNSIRSEYRLTAEYETAIEESARNDDTRTVRPSACMQANHNTV